MKIGKDVKVHDIVLASRFRQIYDLRRFLEQMDAAASDRCLITWIVAREDIDEQICRIIGNEYHPLPEYAIIVNLLQNLGIRPEIEFFETTETHRFASRQDAVENALRGYRIEKDRLPKTLEDAITSGLEYADEYFWRHTPATWALIQWNKKQQVR
jgi:hypothetical protein